MALSIKAPEADKLARQLAQTTGESITEAVIVAMRERLVREQKKFKLTLLLRRIESKARGPGSLAVSLRRSIP
jgi:antitoxin VapB